MKGIRQDRYGYQAFVKVQGVFRSKRYPLDTSMREMQLWRDETRLRLLGRIAPATGGGETFADDVLEYLKAVAQMPTIAWRTDDIGLWVKLFGSRARQSITSIEIRTQLARWRKDYAASTVNHRRTALMHFFTVMEGKSGPNPVRDVPRYRDDSQDAPPKALPLEAVTALLDRMPRSKTKARLTLMAWTGWPHAQIARLQPEDVDTKARRVYVRGRQKGAGVPGRWMAVLPQAWAALKEFKVQDAWGAFSASSARKSLRLAAQHIRSDKKAGKALKEAVEDVTPYVFRHSFLTLVAATTKDDRAVASLGLHSDRRQSDRYTRAATDPRVATALAAVARAVKHSQKKAS